MAQWFRLIFFKKGENLYKKEEKGKIKYVPYNFNTL